MDKPFESTILPKPSPGNKEEAYLYKTAAGVVGRLNETGGFEIESDLNESIFKIEGKAIGTTASQVVMETGCNLNDTIGGLWETCATTVTSTTGSVEIANPIKNSKVLEISLQGNTVTGYSETSGPQVINNANKKGIMTGAALQPLSFYNVLIRCRGTVGKVVCSLHNAAGEKLSNVILTLVDGDNRYSMSTQSRTDMKPQNLLLAGVSSADASTTIEAISITESVVTNPVPLGSSHTLASFQVSGAEYSVIENGKIVEVPKGSTYATKLGIPLTATTTLNVLGATPTNLDVTYPMRKTATMSQDLQQMKAILNSKSNTHIIANYVEDEYKKELSKMEGL